MKTKIQYIKTPIIIKPFALHNHIKDNLLKEINLALSENVKTKQGSDITRCDWGLVNYRREWVNDFLPILEPEILKIYQDLGYDTIKIYNIWFQQYDNESLHNWHVHTECQWTNVYYLNLPEDSPKTEILDPISKEIIQLQVSEGDICCFPSFLIHRAPKNLSNQTKTIISFNSGTNITSDAYK